MTRAFFRNRPAAVALVYLALMLILSVLAPAIAPYSPNRTNTPEAFEAPSARHWFGADQLGRDNLSRVLWGTRTSLQITFLTWLLILGIGLPAGVLAGYYRAWLEVLLMRVIDLALVIPTFFLVLVLVTIFGSNRWILVLVLGVTLCPLIARLSRAETLAVAQREFIAAARALGASNTSIVWRHVLPNILFSTIAGLGLLSSDIIITEAALGYIGASDPSLVSLGRMLSDGQRYLRHSLLMPILPGLAVSLLVLSFNLVGSGLTDALRRGR